MVGAKRLARWLDLGLESGYCHGEVVLVDCQLESTGLLPPLPLVKGRGSR